MGDQEMILVDTETGEYIKNRLIPEGSRLVTKITTPQQEKYYREHVLSFNDQHTYIKFFPKMMRHVEEELTGSEWMFFSRLTEFICYDDCVLRKNGSRKHAAFHGIGEIADALGKNYKLCYKQIRALISKELIAVMYTGGSKHRITMYLCNPYVFFKGKDLNMTVWKEFSKTRWAKFNNEPDLDDAEDLS